MKAEPQALQMDKIAEPAQRAQACARGRRWQWCARVLSKVTASIPLKDSEMGVGEALTVESEARCHVDQGLTQRKCET